MKKIGFLLSGTGTTLQHFIDLEKNGTLNGKIAVVISSKKSAPGVKIAQDANIPLQIIEYSDYKNNLTEYSNAITSVLIQFQCQLVVMGGFLSFYQIPQVFKNRVVNIHPSLIPAFCGHGMYGKKVHEKVLEYGVKVTGCTVHIVNNEYDNGPILAQAVVPVLDNDTVQSLMERVQAKEKELFPQVVNDLLDNRFEILEKKTKRK